MEAGQLLAQASGVLNAVANLPAAPVDSATQRQMAGWQAWAAYLAPMVATVGISVAKAALAGAL